MTGNWTRNVRAAQQRTRKVIHHPDSTTTTIVFHYDPMGYLISETDATGNLIRDYIWLEGMTPVAQIDNTQGSEVLLYLHTDHLMTNRLATDDTQSIVWRWEGEAFGNTPPEELAGLSIHLRFPGQYSDTETGWFYNWNRYYDPRLGRFISSDSIGLDGGGNTFGYAFANVLVIFDPTGLAVYRYGDEFSDRRIPGQSGCLKPVYLGEFIIDWARCDEPIPEDDLDSSDCVETKPPYPLPVPPIAQQPLQQPPPVPTPIPVGTKNGPNGPVVDCNKFFDDCINLSYPGAFAAGALAGAGCSFFMIFATGGAATGLCSLVGEFAGFGTEVKIAKKCGDVYRSCVRNQE